MLDKEFGTCIRHRNCRGFDRRVMGDCIGCGREVSFSNGHLAPPLNKDRLLCGRCADKKKRMN